MDSRGTTLLEPRSQITWLDGPASLTPTSRAIIHT